MRAIWKGSIGFGLVSIPISLFPATRREELTFHLLRASDHSRVNFKRVAEADGKVVPWDQIVKGYEYEKGKYVVLKEEDFSRVDIEATQTVDILNFVKLEEINPLLFSKPYFMQADKGGAKAYALLQESLAKSGKIGISKVVIKERQHLAAVKPQAGGLMLELMRFPDEILDAREFDAPAPRAVSTAEKNMAAKLIESMSVKWNPSLYHDDYREALQKLIEEKIEHGEKSLPPARKSKRPTNVVDLVSVLQESLRQNGRLKASPPKIHHLNGHRDGHIRGRGMKKHVAAGIR